MSSLTKLLSIALLVVIIAGCTGEDKSKKEDYTNQVINVYTSSPNEQSFYQSYGNNILKYFPGIDIQLNFNEAGGVVSSETLDKLQPDLLFLYYSDYLKLQEEGYLLPINFNRDGSQLVKSDYADLMLNMLSDHSGTVYGLSPNVYMNVLFFNKQLFDTYSVEYLYNGMSWEEVLSTAQLFPDQAGFEAVGVTAASFLLNLIAPTNHLTLIDESYNVRLEGDDWKRAIEQVVSLYQQTKVGSVGGAFKSGDAAIYYTSFTNFKEFVDADFEWEFVTMPTHPTHREYNKSMVLDQVISLPITAANPGLSYQVMDTLMSEEVSESYSTGLKFHTISTLKSKMYDYEGLELTNLWDQEAYQLSYPMPLDIEQPIVNQLYQVVDEHLKRAIEGQLTVEECVHQIQSHLKLLIQEAE